MESDIQYIVYLLDTIFISMFSVAVIGWIGVYLMSMKIGGQVNFKIDLMWPTVFIAYAAYRVFAPTPW